MIRKEYNLLWKKNESIITIEFEFNYSIGVFVFQQQANTNCIIIVQKYSCVTLHGTYVSQITVIVYYCNFCLQIQSVFESECISTGFMMKNTLIILFYSILFYFSTRYDIKIRPSPQYLYRCYLFHYFHFLPSIYYHYSSVLTISFHNTYENTCVPFYE